MKWWVVLIIITLAWTLAGCGGSQPDSIVRVCKDGVAFAAGNKNAAGAYFVRVPEWDVNC